MSLSAALAVFALAVSALTACDEQAGNCTRLPGGSAYCITEGPWPEFESEQVTTISYAGRPTQLITRIASDKNGIRFAGLTPLGQTVLSVALSNGVVHAQLPPGMDGRIDGEFLIALLQLAVWPADEIARALPKELSLTESTGKRIIRHGDNAILTITWEGKSLPYTRLRFEAPDARLAIDAAELAGTGSQ